MVNRSAKSMSTKRWTLGGSSRMAVTQNGVVYNGTESVKLDKR